MTSHIRLQIAKHLIDAVHRVSSTSECDIKRLAWCVRCLPSADHNRVKTHQFSIPYRLLQACKVAPAELPWDAKLKWFSKLGNEIRCVDSVQKVEVSKHGLLVQYENKELKWAVLQDVVERKNDYGRGSVIHDYCLTADGDDVKDQEKKQTVLVEFSSPNIAKPFHAGHLRSTIIGNFVANINEALSHKTIRVNYLGDWGTQFGLLGVGYQKYGTSSTLTKDIMEHLYEVYVKINKDVTENPALRKEALEFFSRMEQGEVSAMSLWQYCRDCSVTEYTKVYKALSARKPHVKPAPPFYYLYKVRTEKKLGIMSAAFTRDFTRLGIQFDLYDGESQYQTAAQDIINLISKRGLLQYRGDPPLSYMDLSTPDNPNFHANIQKSDGTSLYITRDIAAAIDRQHKFKFDRAHYVVENGQSLHFKQLISILQRLGYDWAHRCGKGWHVKFGRVDGMSTRRGEVVFLKDILDEAQAAMKETMSSTETTQVETNIDAVADCLGVSAVIIQDLSEPRLRNYKFSWQRALKFTGDTGVGLQYAHARLCSLERRCGVELNPDCDVGLLEEPVAKALIRHIARYDEVLQDSFTDLQSHYLTSYLYQLRRLSNVANKELMVKNQSTKLAEARLLLHHSARQTLANGLRLLGVTPLQRM